MAGRASFRQLYKFPSTNGTGTKDELTRAGGRGLRSTGRRGELKSQTPRAVGSFLIKRPEISHNARSRLRRTQGTRHQSAPPGPGRLSCAENGYRSRSATLKEARAAIKLVRFAAGPADPSRPRSTRAPARMQIPSGRTAGSANKKPRKARQRDPPRAASSQSRGSAYRADKENK